MAKVEKLQRLPWKQNSALPWKLPLPASMEASMKSSIYLHSMKKSCYFQGSFHPLPRKEAAVEASFVRSGWRLPRLQLNPKYVRPRRPLDMCASCVKLSISVPAVLEFLYISSQGRG